MHAHTCVVTLTVIQLASGYLQLIILHSVSQKTKNQPWLYFMPFQLKFHSNSANDPMQQKMTKYFNIQQL